MKLNDYLKLMKPWCFNVEDGERSYPTRRPTVATVIAIESIETNLNSVFKLQEFVLTLFEGEVPDVGAWDLALLYAVAMEYGKAAGEYLRKNLGALLPTITAAANASAA